MTDEEIQEINDRINYLKDAIFITKMSDNYNGDIIAKHQREINELKEILKAANND